MNDWHRFDDPPIYCFKPWKKKNGDSFTNWNTSFIYNENFWSFNKQYEQRRVLFIISAFKNSGSIDTEQSSIGTEQSMSCKRGRCWELDDFSEPINLSF